MKYLSTKKYGHERGLTCAFRQWQTESHCRFLHGYALAFEFTFGTDELDCRNWCVDYGSLKSLKGWLEDMFDHTTLVAEDDPNLEWFQQANSLGLLQLRIMPQIGCEKIVEYVAKFAETWLLDNGYSPRVKLLMVRVWEHEANSAVYNLETN